MLPTREDLVKRRRQRGIEEVIQRYKRGVIEVKRRRQRGKEEAGGRTANLMSTHPHPWIKPNCRNFEETFRFCLVAGKRGLQPSHLEEEEELSAKLQILTLLIAEGENSQSEGVTEGDTTLLHLESRLSSYNQFACFQTPNLFCGSGLTSLTQLPENTLFQILEFG